MHDNREQSERQLQAVKNAIEQLKVELAGKPFNFADHRICRYMHSAISIRQARGYLEELHAVKWITIEEKGPEEGGWILT
jgi:hypothetical protein